MSALLEIEAVRAGYDTGDVLQGVDLTLDQGEVVALLGRNGVGKTTTLRCLAGLNSPWRGSSIELGGRTIAGEPDRGAAWMTGSGHLDTAHPAPPASRFATSPPQPDLCVILDPSPSRR